MNVLKYIGVLVSCFLVVACAAPTTRVLLLDDFDGKVGAVTVSNERGSQVIDSAYQAVDIARARSAPAVPRNLRIDNINKRYDDLFQAQSAPPITYVLNFQSGSALLTSDSQTLVPELLDAIRGRATPYVSVYGHSDSFGQANQNLTLSRERADTVADQIRAVAPQLMLTVESFGDQMPLFPAPPSAEEPRNRRVEVILY